jgi:hypothetical protein
MISPRQLDQIVRADIDQLVADQTSERRTIEYKRELPGRGDADKKEFLADVSSLANAQGGDLVFGISAVDGVPTEARGLADFNEDEVRLRLEQLMRDGLDPRLHGVQMHAIQRFADGPVLILRIPRSWIGPHRMKLAGSSRFYSRGSAGKFEMDTGDIRAAIEASGDLPKRIRDWRDERLGRIFANDGPIQISSNSAMVIHLIPLESFAESWRLPAAQLHRQVRLRPIGAGGWDHRFNIDGFLTFDRNAQRRHVADAYTQLFRSGAIEAVNADLIERDQQGGSYIASGWYEQAVLEALNEYLRSLRDLEVQPPIICLLALLGTKGAYLHVGARRGLEAHTADREMLIMPDVLIEDFEAFGPTTLRPAFDGVWNAFGYEQSFNFNEQGEWALR